MLISSYIEANLSTEFCGGKVMAALKATFPTEEDLVTAFISHLSAGSSPWSSRNYLREFDYISGRTDVLSLSPSNEIVAFEAKLSNWRKALHQAWRNTSFANRVYVVLPRECVGPALGHRDEFDTLGVGLCVVDAKGIDVLINGAQADPVIPWLHRKARRMLIDHDGFGCH